MIELGIKGVPGFLASFATMFLLTNAAMIVKSVDKPYQSYQF